MVRDDKKRGIEIGKQQPGSGVSLVGGGIRIDASAKAIRSRFEIQWGLVYMLLDCSASMTGNKLDQAKAGMIDFVKDAVRKEYLTGLITFDSSATHVCEPTKEISRLDSYLKGIVASGSTNMVDAVKMAHDKLKRFEGSRVNVIATDGQPDNSEATIRAGNLAKSDGIEIITIGTDDADKDFLKRLASRNDLGSKVTREMFAKAISSASLMLPSPKSIKPK